MGFLNLIFPGVDTDGNYAVANTKGCGFDEHVAALMNRKDVPNPVARIEPETTDGTEPATGHLQAG